MLNLLPKEEQRLIIREYRLRLIGIGLLFFALLVVVAFIALVPLFVLSSQKNEAVIKADNRLKEEIALESKDNPSNILEISDKKAAALYADTPTLYFYQLVAEIIEKKTSGVKISGVNFTRSAGGQDVAIMGTARDRGTLLAFAGVLEGIKDFTEVIVPVSNFAPVSDINFSILAKTKTK